MRQYTLARRLILWINVETAWVAAFIVLLLIDLSIGSRQSGMSIYLLIGTLIVTAITISYYIYRLYLNR